jgi:hypothetical protein
MDPIWVWPGGSDVPVPPDGVVLGLPAGFIDSLALTLK